MYQSVFNNKIATDKSNLEVIKLGDMVVSNIKYGLKRKIDRLKFLQIVNKPFLKVTC